MSRTERHWVAVFGTTASCAFVGGTNARNIRTDFGPCGWPGHAPHHNAFTGIACDIDTRTLAYGR